QEGYVERRNSSRVMEPGCAERAIRAHGKYDKAVRVSLIREHKLWCAVRIRRGSFVEVDVDEEEFLVRREHGHGGNTIGLVLRIPRVSLRAGRELAFAVDRHQPDMVGAERVQHVKRALRGTVGQRFGCAALSLHGVPRGLDVQQRESAVFAYTKAGDRIVAAISHKQKLAIWRQDDATRPLERVRPVGLVDRPENPGTGAARGNTFRLGNRAFRRPKIVDDRVPGLICLHVEMSATVTRYAHLFRGYSFRQRGCRLS